MNCQKFAHHIVLKCLYLARIGRPDILWSVNKLARSVTKWTQACDRRLEGDEELQNEPGTSSNSKPTDPVLPYHQRPAASTQGPTVLDNSADEGSEKSDEYSAQSQDSHTTQYFPDLYVLTSDGHWTTTPETHKYAAAAGPFCFLTSENGDQEDICNLITMPCVQRSLYLNERTNNFGNMKIEVPKGLTVEPETCWNAVQPPAEEQQEQEPK